MLILVLLWIWIILLFLTLCFVKVGSRADGYDQKLR